MNIGLYTDTYFPQISGVATSIKTLKEALEAQGNNVFIFTTTDPDVDKNTLEPNVFRFASVPFISFTERRIAYRGLFEAVRIAKEVHLDIVHTQTEFSMGMIGKYVARQLNIPAIHTYHTMYEDYLHYVLNGRLLKPRHVKQFTDAYLKSMNGVIAPSMRVEKLLIRYGVDIPIRVIPTGVDVKAINLKAETNIREKLGISKDSPVILTLSRIALEKKIDKIIKIMPEILEHYPKTKLVIAGDGPDKDILKDQVERLSLEDNVIFTGNIPHEEVGSYYKMADLFVSASDTETQGLTYIESLASGTRCVVYNTDYTEQVFDKPIFGATFKTSGEMLKEVLYYLDHVHTEIPKEELKLKLENISAKHFGSEVLRFYQDVKSLYQASEALND